MIKKLLTILFAGAMTVAFPLTATGAGWELAAIEQADEQISITVTQGAAHIVGGQGQTLEVVSLTGKRVLTVQIDSPSQRVELNIGKGCYILKVGKVVRKITIR